MQTPNGASNATTLNCITIPGPDVSGLFHFLELPKRGIVTDDTFNFSCGSQIKWVYETDQDTDQRKEDPV
jgi:hypothetical protein